MALIINETNLRRLTLNGINITNVTFNGATIARPPLVTTQPAGGTITDNQTKTLSVVADGLGTSLTYQWYKAGQPISGATSSYTFDPTSTGTFAFFCRIEGFGEYTDTSSVNVIVETSAKIYDATITSAEFITDVWGWTLIGEGHDEGNISPRTFAGFTGTVSFNPKCQLGASPSLIGDNPQFSYYLNSTENTGTDRVDILYQGGVAISDIQRDPPDGPAYSKGASSSPKGVDLYNALRGGGSISIQIKITKA